MLIRALQFLYTLKPSWLQLGNSDVEGDGERLGRQSQRKLGPYWERALRTTQISHVNSKRSKGEQRPHTLRALSGWTPSQVCEAHPIPSGFHADLQVSPP